jgi:hypothetical protein
MAKKSQVPPAPEMTALPMAGGDSPLVIDLPDGQKLVVGNLAAGSVIEVATWRGTGRPDSRTSRLMLGMSSAQDKPADAATSEAKKASPSVVATGVGILRAVAGKVGSRVASSKKNRGEKKTSAPLIEKVTPAARTAEAGEVDDWLNSILEKSAKKQAAAKDDGVKVEKVASEKKEAPAKKLVKKAPAKKAPAKKAAAKKPVKKSTTRGAR